MPSLLSPARAAAIALLAFPALLTTAAQPPNIVLFLIDDLGWADSTVYGSTFYETPAMERLAREGLTFTAAYAQPLCSPTRATLLTGQDAPARFHLHQAITGQSVATPVVSTESRPDRVANWPSSRSHLPLEARTIAEALRDGGYQTWHLGKWHLGNEKQFGPQMQGFEKVIAVGGAGPAGGYFAPNRISLVPPAPAGEYICERLTTEACQLLETRDPAKPFFMYFAHYNVHAPYMAKPELVEHFKKKANPANPQHNPVMAAMIRSMDDSLAALLAKLDQLDLTRDTLVVFLSDNGGVDWKNQARGIAEPLPPTSNLPLRGGKCCFYEGGIRVPMIVRLPGQIKAGSTDRTVVQVADLFPTFLRYAGLPAEPNHPLDGEDLTPLFTQKGSLQRDMIFGHFPRPTTTAGTLGGSWVRQGDFKMIRRWFSAADGSHTYELYNLKTDLGEHHNLAAGQPEKVTALAQRLDAWLAETGALLPTKNPRWNGTHEKPPAPAVE